MVDRKHITEATDLSPLWCANNDPHEAHSARNEFNGINYCTGRFSAPQPPETFAQRIQRQSVEAMEQQLSQPPEGVAELIAEADLRVEAGLRAVRFYTADEKLIYELARALTALSSVPPVRDISDEELLVAYERAYRGADTDVHHFAHIEALRAVAALSSTEGTGR